MDAPCSAGVCFLLSGLPFNHHLPSFQHTQGRETCGADTFGAALPFRGHKLLSILAEGLRTGSVQATQDSSVTETGSQRIKGKKPDIHL